MDISGDELDAAGEGAYDATVAADIGVAQDALREQFDLAISWQVLEHVEDVEAAVENVRTYLRVGGTFVALLSGAWAASAVVNRVIPDALGQGLVTKLMNRSADTDPVFPAHYDNCSHARLSAVFGQWRTVQIDPYYRGANYFAFSRTLMRAYLAYENTIANRGVRGLATHYLVTATR